LTILKTLQSAFLLVSLIPAVLLTYLAFQVADHALQRQIEQSLQQESKAVSHNINKMMFERLQNAQTWRRLEVTQDIQVDDIDKRLSKFLFELKSGYRDIYAELFCLNTQGVIVASSDPLSIGKYPATSMGESYIQQDNSKTTALENIQFDLQRDSAILPIRTAVSSQFGKGEIGSMYLMFNWQQIYRILDDAAQNNHDLAIINADGCIIAASKGLRGRHLLLKNIPALWAEMNGQAIRVISGKPWYGNDVMLGISPMEAPAQFPNLNWRILVIENTSDAYIPVHQMAFFFITILSMTSILAIGFSYLVAGRISKPITALTEFTRRFMRDKSLPTFPRNSAGEVGELTDAFLQTITDLDKSRSDLVRISKLAVLGEMSAVMAHEIRTPIGILRSSAQMLSREQNLSTEGRELVTFVESETERLNRLVSTLLSSARPPSPNLQLTDINQTIIHAIDLLRTQADKANIEIRTELSVNMEQTFADGEQITQVLLNLILNAIQILPQGGQVVISSIVIEDTVLIQVMDDGPGIPEDEMVRVFDPFFTKREGGVGLGLAVVQQIVMAHKGQLKATKSKLGGAAFIISLPKDNSHAE
jgi:signal transduction histidine kinase